MLIPAGPMTVPNLGPVTEAPLTIGALIPETEGRAIPGCEGEELGSMGPLDMGEEAGPTGVGAATGATGVKSEPATGPCIVAPSGLMETTLCVPGDSGALIGS